MPLIGMNGCPGQALLSPSGVPALLAPLISSLVYSMAIVRPVTYLAITCGLIELWSHTQARRMFVVSASLCGPACLVVLGGALFSLTPGMDSEISRL